MENNGKKTVTFLFGAGCEGKGQIGLPSGSDFKKNIVLGENAKKVYEFINDDRRNVYKMKNGLLLSWNSYHTFYQTLKENADLYDEFVSSCSNENKKTFYNYEKINENSNIKTNEKKNVTRKFCELYRIKIYNKLKDVHGNVEDKFLKSFLKKISLCHFADSRFSSLRLPNNYVKDVGKVLRILYGAFYSIYKGIDVDFPFDDRAVPVKKRREKLFQAIKNEQKIIADKARKKKDLYYNIIKKCFPKEKYNLSVITTNYTNFAEKLMGLCWENVAYIHGKLDRFEDVKSKIVNRIDKFSSEEIIMPFLFVPSGVKPVVCSWQIEQYAKACDWIKSSDYLIILGYGLNDDDEHVINFLRERMLDAKKADCTLFFYNSSKTKIIKHMGINANAEQTSNFEEKLMEFVK